MPLYMSNVEPDGHHLDYNTRERMVAHREEETRLFLLGMIFTFIIGVVVGSGLHDKFFHLTEQVMR